jgi:hypothetical protein
MVDLSGIIKQLITERDRLNAAIAALQSANNGKGHSAKRGISAAGRARIAAAQRKRWAKIRAKKRT